MRSGVNETILGALVGNSQNKKLKVAIENVSSSDVSHTVSLPATVAGGNTSFTLVRSTVLPSASTILDVKTDRTATDAQSALFTLQSVPICARTSSVLVSGTEDGQL